MAGTHDATFYVQITADFGRTWQNGEYVQSVSAAKAVALTQKRPERQRPGTVLVKLTVRVPDAAFLPLRPEEEKALIGWWLNKGSAQPKRRPSSFMLNHAAGAPYWGESIRERIARQLPAIAHWSCLLADYREIPTDEPATWFIDPPYSGPAGRHYRKGNRGFDYAELAAWCQSLPGQVIVCEADDADWLPFRPLALIDGTEGKQKRTRARTEVVWERSA